MSDILNLRFIKKSNLNKGLPRKLDWYLTSTNEFNVSIADDCKIVLPGNIEGISNYGIYNKAFYGAEHIKNLYIPSSVLYIGAEAFSRSSIQNIYMYTNEPPQIVNSAFDNMDEELIIYVPQHKKEAFHTIEWVVACGGEDLWQNMIREGDYTVSENEIEPLYCFDADNNIELNIAANITKVGLMPFLTWDELAYKSTEGALQVSEKGLFFKDEVYRYFNFKEISLTNLTVQYGERYMYDYNPPVYFWEVDISSLKLDDEENTKVIIKINNLDKLSVDPLFLEEYQLAYKDPQGPGLDAFTSMQYVESIYVSTTLNVAENESIDDVWLKLATLTPAWEYGDELTYNSDSAEWKNVSDHQELEITSSNAKLYIIVYEHAMAFESQYDNTGLQSKVTNKFAPLTFTIEPMVVELNTNLKPNACYNNKFGTLKLNSKRIETLAFQKAQIEKLIIGPEVEYIAPHAFLNAIVKEADCSQSTDYYVDDEGNVRALNDDTLILQISQ